MSHRKRERERGREGKGEREKKARHTTLSLPLLSLPLLSAALPHAPRRSCHRGRSSALEALLTALFLCAIAGRQGELRGLSHSVRPVPRRARLEARVEPHPAPAFWHGKAQSSDEKKREEKKRGRGRRRQRKTTHSSYRVVQCAPSFGHFSSPAPAGLALRQREPQRCLFCTRLQAAAFEK